MTNPSTFFKPEFEDDQEEEDYEQFNMDDDYEGGEFDENGDFYYKSDKKPKKSRGLTKDQQIYGDFINVQFDEIMERYVLLNEQVIRLQKLRHLQTRDEWDNRDFSSKSMFSNNYEEAPSNLQNIDQK